MDNLSNHLPVELCFSQYGLNYSTVTDEPVSNSSRILWRCVKRDDILMYQLVLNVELTKMTVNATLSTAVNFEETTHCDAIDSTCKDIIAACIHASNMSVQISSGTGQSRKKCIPGWNEHVRPFREQSLLWHIIWSECNKPYEGAVYDCMRNSRRAYHKAIQKNS